MRFIKPVLVVISITGVSSLIIWLSVYTPFPVYILDAINLQHYILPDITCNNCNNFTYSYIIENQDFCGDKDIFLLILVASYHPNVDARKAIRNTWGSVKEHKGMNIRTLFLFGTHADQNFNKQMFYELEHYGDVVQANFKDKYRTLTNKTMMGLGWVLRFCPQVKYILKTDDDAFNVPQRYVDYLIDTHLQTFAGGYCFTILPDRSPSSKFYTPYSMYPQAHYPLYCSGPGYVLSISAVTKIVAVAPNVIFLTMEDVFVSGMCRVAAGIQYIQIEGTVISKDVLTPCNIATWAKNSHKVVPGETTKIWNKAFSISADKIEECSTISTRTIIVVIVFLVIWCRIMFIVFKNR